MECVFLLLYFFVICNVIYILKKVVKSKLDDSEWVRFIYSIL